MTPGMNTNAGSVEGVSENVAGAEEVSWLSDQHLSLPPHCLWLAISQS